MSVRRDWQDVQFALTRLRDRVAEANVGDYHPEISDALQVVENAIEAADRAVQVAEQKHRIDMANAERAAAEERLAELGS